MSDRYDRMLPHQLKEACLAAEARADTAEGKASRLSAALGEFAEAVQTHGFGTREVLGAYNELLWTWADVRRSTDFSMFANDKASP